MSFKKFTVYLNIFQTPAGCRAKQSVWFFETRFSQMLDLASIQQKRRWKWREGSVSCLSVYFLRVEREACQHTYKEYAVKKMQPFNNFPISVSSTLYPTQHHTDNITRYCTTTPREHTTKVSL